MGFRAAHQPDEGGGVGVLAAFGVELADRGDLTEETGVGALLNRFLGALQLSLEIVVAGSLREPRLEALAGCSGQLDLEDRRDHAAVGNGLEECRDALAGPSNGARANEQDVAPGAPGVMDGLSNETVRAGIVVVSVCVTVGVQVQQARIVGDRAESDDLGGFKVLTLNGGGGLQREVGPESVAQGVTQFGGQCGPVSAVRVENERRGLVVLEKRSVKVQRLGLFGFQEGTHFAFHQADVVDENVERCILGGCADDELQAGDLVAVGALSDSALPGEAVEGDLRVEAHGDLFIVPEGRVPVAPAQSDLVGAVVPSCIQRAGIGGLGGPDVENQGMAGDINGLGQLHRDACVGVAPRFGDGPAREAQARGAL